MTKKLVWRLSTKPTVDDLTKAVSANLISKEDARQMLVKEEDEKNIDKDELKEIKEEIKFLRGLVLELSKKEPQVIYKYLFNEVKRWDPPVYPYKYESPWWGKEYVLTCQNMAKSIGDSSGTTVMKTMLSNMSIK